MRMPHPSCLLGHHSPLRRKVIHDGTTFHGECRHCGANVRRYGHKDWRRETTA